MKTNKQIRDAIARIERDGFPLLYTDAGQDGSGPSVLPNAELSVALNRGLFRDAVAVPLDRNLLAHAAETVGDRSWVLDSSAAYTQIEFGFETIDDNPYHVIAWIWED